MFTSGGPLNSGPHTQARNAEVNKFSFYITLVFGSFGSVFAHNDRTEHSRGRKIARAAAHPRRSVVTASTPDCENLRQFLDGLLRERPEVLGYPVTAQKYQLCSIL